MNQQAKPKSAFNELRDIGVIWVIDEAIKLGFHHGNPDWANLGQGEPETGEMSGAPPRISHFSVSAEDNGYGPVNGLEELRKAIAAYYNRLYRQGKASQYTFDNVSIAMGGRLALTRIFTILGKIRLGYKVPEYPAYEDMLNDQQQRIDSVCVPTAAENNYSISSEAFSKAVQSLKLDAFLLSNPCNPTGHVIKGSELDSYVRVARQQNCALVLDEVYSHFIYENGKPAGSPVSAAAFVEDVNTDPVLIVDALTKSFRYPGWRLAWVLGPRTIMDDMGRAASAIDGGPSLPVQRAALQLFAPGQAEQETRALRNTFSRKQNLMLKTLQENGIGCSADAGGTFYIWGDVSRLPSPLNTADGFFREALKHKVVVVPGHLFDIHPGVEKKERVFHNFVRFSFGPTESNLTMGLARIATLIHSYR